MKEVTIRRGLAFLLDMFLVTIAYNLVINLIPEIWMRQEWVWAGLTFEGAFDLYGFLTVAYFAGCDLLNGGESLGKDIWHLKTTRPDGEQPDYGKSLLRTLLKMISIWMLPVAVFLFLWKGRGFTIQDYLTGTEVRLWKQVDVV